MANELIIACAGSGKTTVLVERALAKANTGETVLITTFTEACEEEIKSWLKKIMAIYLTTSRYKLGFLS